MGIFEIEIFVGSSVIRGNRCEKSKVSIYSELRNSMNKLDPTFCYITLENLTQNYKYANLQELENQLA